MAYEVGKLEVAVGTKIADLQKGMRAAAAEVATFSDKAGASLKSVGQDMQAVGAPIAKAGAAITAAFGGVAIASTKVGMTFEKEILLTAQVAGGGLEELSTTARKLGETTAFSATQAAQGMYALASAGLSVEEIIAGTGDALKFAGGQGVQLEHATGLLAATMSQFGLSAEDTTRIVDVYTVSINKSQLNAYKLAEGMKYAGTMGSALGWSLEETTAALAQFANLGLEGSMAGTALRMSMNALLKPTTEMTKTLAEMGLKIEDIVPTAHNFGEIIKTISERHITAEQAVKVFGTRAGANIAALADRYREGKIDIEGFTQALVDSAGATEEKYRVMMDTVWGQVETVKSAIQEALISIFETYKDDLKDVAAGITDLVKAFGDFVKEHPNLISSTLKFGLAIGGVATAFGTVTVATGMVISNFGNLAVAIGNVTPKIAALIGQVNALKVAKVGLVGAAGAAGFAIGHLAMEYLGLGEATGKVTDKIYDWLRADDEARMAREAEIAQIERYNKMYDRQFSTIQEALKYHYANRKASEDLTESKKKEEDQTKKTGQTAKIVSEEELQEIEKKKAALKDYLESYRKENADAFEKAAMLYEQDLEKFGWSEEGKRVATEKCLAAVEEATNDWQEKLKQQREEEDKDFHKKRIERIRAREEELGDHAIRLGDFTAFYQEYLDEELGVTKAHIDEILSDESVSFEERKRMIAGYYEYSKEERDKDLEENKEVIESIGSWVSGTEAVLSSFKMAVEGGGGVEGFIQVASRAAATMGPQGQIAAGVINVGSMLVDMVGGWMNRGDRWNDHWKRTMDSFDASWSDFRRRVVSIRDDIRPVVAESRDLTWATHDLSDTFSYLFETHSKGSYSVKEHADVFTTGIDQLSRAMDIGTDRFYDAQAALQGLISRATAMSESVTESIIGIEREFYRPDQLMRALSDDILNFQAALQAVQKPEERLDILEKMRQATEELYREQIRSTEDAGERTEYQTRAIEQLSWIQGEIEKVQSDSEDQLSQLNEKFDSFLEQASLINSYLKRQLEGGGQWAAANQERLDTMIYELRQLGELPSYQRGGFIRFPQVARLEAQEGVLNPRGMRTLGGSVELERLNRGEPARGTTGGTSLNINFTGAMFARDAATIVDDLMYSRYVARSGKFIGSVLDRDANERLGRINIVEK